MTNLGELASRYFDEKQNLKGELASARHILRLIYEITGRTNVDKSYLFGQVYNLVMDNPNGVFNFCINSVGEDEFCPSCNQVHTQSGRCSNES